jgi:hypothetical protein
MVLRQLIFIAKASRALTFAAARLIWLAGARAFLIAIALAAGLAAPAKARAGEPESALQEGRAALARKDLSAALAAYRPIGPRDALWPDKAEDLIRFHLIEKRPLEAWRIVQLARRIGRAPPQFRDYERLATLRAGACPLALEGNDEAATALLSAAAFRASDRLFARGGDFANSGAEPGSSLAPGLTHFLADIPKAELIKGQGCRLPKLFLASSAQASLRSEERGLAQALGAHFDAAHPLDAMPRLLILARGLFLASEARDDSARGQYLALRPSAAAMPWSALPDPERRLFFRAYFAGARLSELPEASRPEAQAAAVAIVRDGSLAEPGASLGPWLAFIDLESISARPRAALLARAEKSGAFEGRAWALYQLARAQHEAGQATDALTTLRRLLVEGEEALDSDLENACVELTARIFSEHQLNERVIGALQASVPSRLWGSLLEQARLQAAFEGRARDFNSLSTMARKRGSAVGSGGLAQDAAWALLGSIARRDRRRFAIDLKHEERTSLRARKFVAGRLARYLASDPSGPGAPGNGRARAELAPFAQALAQDLQSRLKARPTSGEPDNSAGNPTTVAADELADLAAALAAAHGSQAGDSWSAGAQSVRRGTVRVGVAKAAPGPPIPNSIKIDAPAALPLRELIFVPGDVAGRAWTLSTALQ